MGSIVYLFNSFSPLLVAIGRYLVGPMFIAGLVVTLIPPEILNACLVLFGIDVIFLIFRFLVPGIISGSVALGQLVSSEERKEVIRGKK